MFISRDPALEDSGEFVLPLSNPVKWPLFLPTQVVYPCFSPEIQTPTAAGFIPEPSNTGSGSFSFSVPGAL